MLAQRIITACRRSGSLLVRTAPSTARGDVRWCFYQRSFSSAPSSNCNRKRRTRQVSFLTDVEGDASYFDRFVENSRVLCFEPTNPSFENSNAGSRNFFPYNKQVTFRADSSMLVYGGDACDKGGSDLYVLRQLLSLHHRYPDRVHLLMGNRDINKMRICSEMGSDHSDGHQRLPYHGGCWWLVHAVTRTQFSRRHQNHNNTPPS